MLKDNNKIHNVQPVLKWHTALINIDFINDIVHKDGAFGATYAKIVEKNKVIENANRAIDFARKFALPIFFVKVGFSSDYKEVSANNVMFSRAKEAGAFKLNTWGTEFHSKLDIDKEKDNIIVKHRVNAFYNTELEKALKDKRINKIIFTGVATDLAIHTTARDALDRDYRVCVCKDACAAYSEEVHLFIANNLSRVTEVIETTDLDKSILESPINNFQY